MTNARESIFKNKANELLKFLIDKDRKYAGDVPLGNIKEYSVKWDISPIKVLLIRIHDKLNRISKNLDDKEILREEIRDIWGYSLIILILMDEGVEV